MKRVLKNMSICFILILIVLVSTSEDVYAISEADYGKMIFIGDSYSRGFMAENKAEDPYPLSWVNKTADILKINLYRVSLNDDLGRRGGAGFCASGHKIYGSDHEVTFSRQLKEYTENQEYMKYAAQVKYIVVLGGYNEVFGKDFNNKPCLDYNTIYNKVVEFIKIARANFPNAKIIIGMVGYHANDTNIQNALSNVVYNAYKDAAEQTGAEYLYEIETVLKNPKLFSDDKYHPNESGQEAIAKKLSDYLKKDVGKTVNKAVSTSGITYSKVSSGEDNKLYFSNLKMLIPGNDNGDPFVIKNGNTYYIYTTGNVYYTTTNFKSFSGPKTAVTSNLPKSDYKWAPEVYKIGSKYYLLQSYITWGNGYPYGNGTGYIGLAETTDLNKGFTYVKRINVNIEKISTSNKNYIDGNLLIDNGRYYLYYKAEYNQSIYVTELDSNFNPKGNPILCIPGNAKKGWGNNVSEAPEVFKHDGYYTMMYSSGSFKAEFGNDSIYAVGYAWSSSPTGKWTIQSVDERFPFFYGNSILQGNSGYYGLTNTNNDSPTYAPGHNAYFPVGYNNETYNVYHSAYFDSSKSYKGRKVNLVRMGTSAAGDYYTDMPTNNNQPLVSGALYNGAKYYKTRDYSITTSKDNKNYFDILNDGALYGATSGLKKWAPGMVKGVNKITLTMKDRYNITDIWIGTDNHSLLGNNALVIINEGVGKARYNTYSFASLIGTNYYKKIQLPELQEGIKKVEIRFAKSVNLMEVTPIRKENEIKSHNQITVTYDYAGINPKSKQVDYGKAIGALPTVSKKGYTFDGWYLGTKKIDTSYVVKNDITIAPHFTIKTYTLTINPNGGVLNNSKSIVTKNIQYNGKEVLGTPKKDNYTFKGWKIEKGSDSKLSGSTLQMGANNTTVIANYVANTYTLTINPNGGTYNGSTQNTSAKVKYNESITLATPTRDKYTFTGWTTTCGKVSENKYTQNASKNCTISANWQAPKGAKTEYTIDYMLMELDGKTYKSVIRYNEIADEGATITGKLIDYPGFETPAAKTIKISSDNSKNVIEYKYKRKKYTLKINYNNGSKIETREVFYDEHIDLEIPEKNGYTFTDWTVNGKINSNNNITITDNTTISANYQKVTYTISYDLKGGKFDKQQPTKYDTESNNIVIDSPTKQGYTFSDFVDDNGNHLINNTIPKGSYGNLTLRANYLLNSYTLEIDPNGGKYNGIKSKYTMNVKYTDTVEVMEPLREGYTFTGWKVEGEKTSVEGNKVKMGYTNSKITAQWKEKSYTITIDANGGKYEGNNQQTTSLNLNDKIELKDPTRKNYTFIKWESECGEFTGNKFTLICPNDTSIKAIWIENNYDYLTKYYIQDLNSDTYTIDSAKAGNAEVGAKATGELKEIEGFTKPSPETIIVSENKKDNVINYYYKRNTNTIVINGKKKKLQYGEKVELEHEDKIGYNFDGWNVENGIIDGNTLTVKGDTKVEARYTPIKYNITYNLDNGILENSIDSYTIESNRIIIREPKKEGYTFVGWKGTDINNMSKTIVISKGSTGNRQYSAVWLSNDLAEEYQNDNSYVTLILGIIFIFATSLLFMKRQEVKKFLHKLAKKRK